MFAQQLLACMWGGVSSAGRIIPWQQSSSSHFGGAPGGMALVLVLDGDVASAARQTICLVRHARQELLLCMQTRKLSAQSNVREARHQCTACMQSLHCVQRVLLSCLLGKP